MSTITYDYENVTSLFKMLLGTNADAFPSKTPGCAAPRVVATYVHPQGDLAHVLALSLAIANGAGASLTRIPAGLATEGTKKGSVPEGIRENLEEVFNVCVNCFPAEVSGRIVLGSIYYPHDTLPDDLTKRLDQNKDAVTLEVDLGGYGRGTMLLA